MNKTVTINLPELAFPIALVKDTNAFCDAEAETGINLFRASMGGNLGARELRALLLGCLRKGQPKLTVDEVGSLFDRDDADIILNALSDAMGWNREDLVRCEACDGKGWIERSIQSAPTEPAIETPA